MDLFKTFFVIFPSFLCACQHQSVHDFGQSRHHIHQQHAEQLQPRTPSLQRYVPYLPNPHIALAPQPKYSISATQSPLEDILLALAKDAGMNMDLQGQFKDQVSIHIVDQSITTILNRFQDQGMFRYELKDNHITVYANTQYQKLYSIPYLNVERNAKGYVALSLQLDGEQATQQDNRSLMRVDSEANHPFWATIEKNLYALVEDDAQIVINRTTGSVQLTADSKTHDRVRAFIDNHVAQSHRQVLVEATVVEVNLNRSASSGIDWARLGRFDEWAFTQQLTSPNLNSSDNVFSVAFQNEKGNFSSTVKLLEEFGDVKVLSSPKIMALNNQPSIMKVVDNRVYFTLNVESATASGGATQTAIETKVNTIPVGFSMSLTPFISHDDVLLNIRPSISRIVRFVNDPSPLLAAENIVSAVPEVQVREMETVLKLKNGQVAILGGLMQDTRSSSVNQLPTVGDVPIAGELFKGKENQIQKSELLIFLKPIIVDHMAAIFHGEANNGAT